MNFVLKGIEDYVAYESCLTLGLDVDDYAMEAIDFKKIKETVSRKFNEVKTWITERWNDIKAAYFKIATIAVGKKTDSKYLQGKPMSKEEREQSAKSRRYYQALARSEDVIKEGAEKFVEDMKIAAKFNTDPQARKNAETYTEIAYRSAGASGNLKDISDKFKDLEEYIANDGTQFVIMSDMSEAFANDVIKEGKRMLKLGEVMMKGPIRQLLAALTGVLKMKDIEGSGVSKPFQIAVQALNFIGNSARFIFKVITFHLQPLFRLIKLNSNTTKDINALKKMKDDGIHMNISERANKMMWNSTEYDTRAQLRVSDNNTNYFKIDDEE